MANFRINGGVVLDYTSDGWAEFKKWLDGTYATLRYAWVDEGLAYNIVANDDPFYRTFSINKTDASDFEANYKKQKSGSGVNTAKMINSSLKNGSSANMAVNGSVTPQVFVYNPPSGRDILVEDVCLIAETSNALAFGNKFIDTTIGTLTNGLLLEIKANDEAYTWATLKRTRDVVELSKGDGMDLITSTPNFVRFCLWLPPNLVLSKDGSFASADYLKVTVRDDLRAITYMEMFYQGVKL